MPRSPSSVPFQRSGYWLRLGRRQVWLEPSELTDQLLARQAAARLRERARLLRQYPGPW